MTDDGRGDGDRPASGGGRPTATNPLRLLVATAVSVALACASYYLVEQRFRRSSRRALHPATAQV